jgi:hypothetical protein
LKTFNEYGRGTGFNHVKRLSRGTGKVNNTGAHHWPPVIDAHSYLLSVCLVGNTQHRPERQRWMGAGKLAGVKDFT